MKLEETRAHGLVVLSVGEARIDASNGAELKQAVAALAAQGERRLVIDLSQVQFVDSTGLGALVGGLKALGRDGELVMCGLNDVVTSLFKLTRLDRVFRTFPSTAAALAALERRSEATA